MDWWTFEAYAHDLEVWSKIPREAWLHSLENEKEEEKFSDYFFTLFSFSLSPILSLTRAGVI